MHAHLDAVWVVILSKPKETCIIHLIQCFLGLTRNHNPNSISIGSAVFAGLTIVTDRPDRQTDHATPCITIGCIYGRSTAMRPNNFLSLGCVEKSIIYFAVRPIGYNRRYLAAYDNDLKQQ